MNLIIDKTLFEEYPGVLVGVLVVHNIDNSKSSPKLTELLRTAEKDALSKLKGIPIIEQPFIASWREAYRKFGAKPSDYPSSIENLLKRTQKGEELRHVNNLVDIYNIVSLTHFVPVGGEDLAKVSGDILLTKAGQNEAPVVLLGEKEARAPHVGEIIYKDAVGTLCRRWNWKEAERTKLTEATKDAILVIECLPPQNETTLEKAIQGLSDLIKGYCGGDVASQILSATNSSLNLL